MSIVIDDLGFPASGAIDAVHHEQDRRRALEAYHFFYPTVSMEGILQGQRDAGAIDNESALMFLTAPHHVGFTLNSDTPYFGGGLDLRKSGPMVIELPAGPLVGVVNDHHQRWVADLGLAGAEGAAGAKHLILPPDSDAMASDGYVVSRSQAWANMFGVRALPLRGDLAGAFDLMRAVKVYPLAAATDPPGFTLIDLTDRPVDCSCLRWEDNLDYWHAVHRVIDTEPPIEEMRPMLGMLAESGIEAGKPSDPDAQTRELLEEAARTGREEMLVAAFASRRPDRAVWADRAWEWPALRYENGAFERDGSLDVEARDRWFAQAIATSPAMFRRAAGQGSVYLLGHRDSGGNYLDGGLTYRLTIPLPVPAGLFWSVTIYDARTRSELVSAQDQAALRSLFEDLHGDGGAIDLFFGPECPEGVQGRWLQTVPGHGWFTYFRIYGPGEPAFDGSWKLNDFQPI